MIRILDDGTLVVTPYKEVSKSDNTSDLLWKDSTYPTKEFLMGKHTYSEDPNFVNIPSKYTGLSKENSYIQKPVLAAFEKMYADAKAAGITLRVTSASRNFNTQKYIWESKIKEYTEKYPDRIECAKRVLKYNSLPGTSRHHWGTDIDLISKQLSYWNSTQGKRHTRGFRRMLTNMASSSHTVKGVPPDMAKRSGTGATIPSPTSI